MSLKGKSLLCTQDWSKEDLDKILKLAETMKVNRYSDKFTSLLAYQTFFMFFYNPSVRTRQTFECAATELGAHAQFLEPSSMRLKTSKSAGETNEDAAKVMSRYATGLGIRILENKIGQYGEGQKLLEEYVEYGSIPIISMAHDKFHPCQGMADIMGWIEWLGNGVSKPLDFNAVKGKKLVVTWAAGALARSLCSVQEALLIGSRYGMDITLAHPEEYPLDPDVINLTKQNCRENGTTFEEVYDPETAYENAHVVYSRNWMSPEAYKNGEFLKQQEIEKALTYKDKGWICDKEKMDKSDNAIFTHPMPIDRGNEVTDEIASGDRSCVYDVAENRLHVQKAIMALTINGYEL